jgi:RHS repeat-associated protein
MPSTTSGGSAPSASVVPTIEEIRYFFKDHLGSVVTVTNGNMVILQRMKYDVWGTRNQYARDASVDKDPYLEERGFTGHEHLDEVGLIHMNGRIYDPTIARFLQADPIIQDGYDGQNYNRYSYVVNNPLSLTDPSGFSWWSKWRAPILALIAGALTAGAASWMMTAGATYGQAGALSFGAFEFAPAGLTGTGQAVAAAAGGFAAGGVAGGNLRSAVAGAVGALAMSVGLSYFNLPHGSPFTAGEFVGKVAIHGAVGCVRSAMAGGSCGGGAKSGAFAEFAGNLMGEYGAGLRTGSPAHMIAQVAAGCAGGAISGGRCSDGAFTAAFNYLFNELAHSTTCKQRGYCDDSPFSSPTKSGQIRSCDAAGCGDYDAARGSRRHLGYDYVANPGDEILSPISGTVVRIKNPGAEGLSGLHIRGADGYEATVFYIKPHPGIVGSSIEAGNPIGIAQEIRGAYNSPRMTPHVHVTFYNRGAEIDPARYFK